MTSAREQVLSDGTRRPTGTFLGEFYEPYEALRAAGYSIAVATPEGRPPTIDPESLDDKYWDEHPEGRGAAQQLFKKEPVLLDPLTMEQALQRSTAYQRLIVPGAQGVMVDLLDDARVHRLVSRFAESHRPVGLICHAPALLVRMQQPGSLQGRRMTAVSGLEELYIETFVMDAEPVFRGVGGALDERGYRHAAAFPGSAHAVRDCNLVTSQNPFSEAAFNEAYLAALRDYRRGARCVLATSDGSSSRSARQPAKTSSSEPAVRSR